MRVLQVHNRYRALGGEDTVQQLELDLLQRYGHEVHTLLVTNETLSIQGLKSVRAGMSTVWSQSSGAELRRRLRLVKPDIVHVHNTFPQLSPSIYWAAQSEGVPVVQTLHNYRLTCANGILLKEGKPCEACVGTFPISALHHRCYRDSLSATAAVVAMQAVHRALGTYKTKIDAYIALTEFARSVMARAGLPKDRIHVKPNFLPDPLQDFTSSLPERANQIVFVGRITHEKAVELLLRAWANLNDREWNLVIIGDGPDRADLQREFNRLANVEWRGWLDHDRVLREVASSRYLVISSRWYEGFPMVLVEAMAMGTPAIVPRHGPFPEIAVYSDRFSFQPSSHDDLARVVATAMNDSEWPEYHARVRRTYETTYTPEANYRQLMKVYDLARENKGQ